MKRRTRSTVGNLSLSSAGEAVCTPEQIYGDPKWPLLQYASVALTVKVPLGGVRLRDVQELSVGATIASSWPAADEVPLYAGGVVLSWCEFEGTEQMMAVRVTRLA